MTIYEKKIILLNSSGITGAGVGSLFLKDLISSASNDVKFDDFEIKPFLISNLLSNKNLLSRFASPLFMKSGLIQSLRLFYYINYLIDKQVNVIEKKLRDKNYDFIWIITSTPELIFLGEKLVEKGYDVRVNVWDDPIYIARNLNLPKSCTTKIINSFSNLLKGSTKGLVISYKMQNDYAKNYSFRSEVVRHGVNSIKLHKKPSPSNKINIGFAGSLYCKKEWNSFLKALSDINWCVDGKDIYIHHVGTFPRYGVNKNPRVKLYGWKPFNQTLDILQSMDIGYLPYWFSDKYKVPAETSFPGKMSAYASANLAIFHHAPDYTEVTKFLKSYPFGVSCSSNSAKEIIDKLKCLVKNMNSIEYSNARTLALEHELSSNANKKKFEDFIS